MGESSVSEDCEAVYQIGREETGVGVIETTSEERNRICFFCYMLPVIVSIDVSIVLGAQVFDGEAVGCLSLKLGSPIGEISLMLFLHSYSLLLQ